MKIAQVAPLYESVPPKLYGGTERVVSYLTEECVRQGHEVTLFASGDSRTQGKLRPMCAGALRFASTKLADPLAQHMRMIEIVAREKRRFDVVHFHIDYLHFPVTRRERIPALTTLHNRLDIPDQHRLYREYREMNLVSISDAQRQPMPSSNWLGTVYHGLPEELYEARTKPGAYLAFLGRISPEKRVDRAIEIAKRAGMPLKIAAKVDAADQSYFDSRICRLLAHPLIEYVGEISERQKCAFLADACALLFPVDWPEPFGLVMAEALACGTPVVAYRAGSVPEVIEDGKTGYIVESIEQAVDALRRIGELDRGACRHAFEQRFSARRMCHDYLSLYRSLCARTHDEKQRPLRSVTDGVE
jgi:glycosyltransferase involved in cell wall biosynthesis